MKRPLKGWRIHAARAWREVVCWSVGHRWQFTGKWLGVGKGYEYPYKFRYVCRRCHWKRNESESPAAWGWWLQAYRAASRFWADWKFHALGPWWQPRDGYGYHTASLPVRIGMALTSDVLHSLFQAWGCYVRFLPFQYVVMEAITGLQRAFDRLWEPHIVHYYWARTDPDSNVAFTGDGPTPRPHGIHWRKEWGEPPQIWLREWPESTPSGDAETVTWASGTATEMIVVYPEAA